MTLMTADLEKKFEKYPFASQEKEGNAPKQESTDDDIMNHLNTPSTSSIIDDSFYGDSEFDSEELDAEGFSDFDSNDLY